MRDDREIKEPAMDHLHKANSRKTTLIDRYMNIAALELIQRKTAPPPIRPTLHAGILFTSRTLAARSCMASSALAALPAFTSPSISDRSAAMLILSR